METAFDTAPSLDDLRSITDRVRFILDVKACGKRAEELIGLTIAADEAQAAAEQAKAAQAARVAELDNREAAVRAREVEVHAKEQLVEGRHGELTAYGRRLTEIENQIKIRLLRHAGVLDHYNPDIQRLPEWAAVDRATQAPPDIHYDDDSVMAVTEPVPGLPPGVTLSRSRESTAAERRAMRRVVDHH